jgi:hypothetical protein
LGLPQNPGSVGNLGHEVARSTIANMLKEHGLEPAPERERKTTWKEFLSRHREVIVAADFFTIEAWTRKGLTRGSTRRLARQAAERRRPERVQV